MIIIAERLLHGWLNNRAKGSCYRVTLIQTKVNICKNASRITKKIKNKLKQK